MIYPTVRGLTLRPARTVKPIEHGHITERRTLPVGTELYLIVSNASRDLGSGYYNIGGYPDGQSPELPCSVWDHEVEFTGEPFIAT